MSLNKLISLLEAEINQANALVPYTGPKDDDTVIEAELVDDEDKPLDNELEKEHSHEFKKLNQKCYAVIQTTNTAINTVLNTTTGNIVTDIKKKEIIQLLKECNLILKGIAENEVTKLPNEEEEKVTTNTINRALENNEQLHNQLSKKNKVITKKEIFDSIEKIYKDFDEILKAKLPQSLISAIATASPLTSIVYQNADLLKGIGKTGYNTIKTVTRSLTGNMKEDK